MSFRHAPLLGLVTALTLSATAVRATAQFVNGGFELGTFAGWTVDYNSWNDAGNSPPTYGGAFGTTLPAGHPAPIIVSSAQVVGTVALQVLCDTRMARLNDLVGNNHVTRVSQTVVLRAEDIDGCGVAHVRVCWIGVVDNPANLQDHLHPPLDQPAFLFKLEHNTTIVDHAEYWSSDPGLSDAGPSGTGGRIKYRQECTPLIVLHAVPGDTVKVEMEVRDCALGGHGAMAFLDCAEILPGYPVTRIQVEQNGCGDVAISNSGLLVPETWYPASLNAPFISGDFNGDGRCDLADINGSTIRTYIGTGSGFLPFVSFSATGWVNFLAGDFDGDGTSEIAGWISSSGDLEVWWYSGGFPTTVLWHPAGGTGIGPRFWVGDFNADGLEDLVRLTNTNVQVATATGNQGTPFNPFANWGPNPGLPSFTVNSDVYVCDFNGDTRDDLMFSWTTGIHVLLSTGTTFQPKQKWSSVGPPASGSPWFLGNFDCDGRCDIARYLTDGTFETVPLTPPGTSSLIPVQPLTYTPVFPTYTAVGDFDGNGRDDFACAIPGQGMVVMRTCTGCSCMHVHVAEPICDPNDATRYTLPVAVTNRSGRPVQTFYFTPNGSFSVNPPGISFADPLVSGKSRTFMLELTGATEGVLHSMDVTMHLPPGADPGFCTEKICFTPPPCLCMDLYSENLYCRPDGSGVVCLDFTVQNTSGVPIHYIRLTPASAFSPSVIVPVPTPLLTGQSFAVTNCAVQVTVPGGSTLSYTVELLDSGMNLICDHAGFGGYTVDVPVCPTELGWCCTNVGWVTLTAADCATRNGTFFTAHPGISYHCNIDPPTIPRTGSISSFGGAFVTIDPELRMLAAGIGSTGNDGFTVAFDPVAEITVPLEPMSPDLPASAHTSLRARGSLGGVRDSQLGDLHIARAGTPYSLTADFSAFGSDGIYAIVYGAQPPAPLWFDSDALSAVADGRPLNVRLIKSNYPVSSHGFAIEFAGDVPIEISGALIGVGHELHLLAVTAPRETTAFTAIELRAVDLPYLGVGPIQATPLRCQGDLNGDCLVDQEDVDIFLIALQQGGEGDVDGDGAVTLQDLNFLFANLNTVCECHAPCPAMIAESFEAYAAGEICGQGGWEEWVPSDGVCGSVVGDEVFDGAQSLKIVGSVAGPTGLGDDTVRRVAGVTAGRWTFRAMTFVPLSATGTGYVNLLTTYDDPPGAPPTTYRWAVQVAFHANTNQVTADFNAGSTALIKGRWVEFRVEFDLDTDRADYYYDGVRFVQNRSWTCGVGAPFCGTERRLQAIDLYAGEPADGGTSGMYFDALVLRQSCDPFQSIVPGDLNCDGRVNNFDIDPFVLAISDPSAYDLAYPDCDISAADVNQDGRVDNFDIDPFVECIALGGCP